MLKQNQKIKQKSHEWTIKNLHLWFLNFVIFITTFLWVLKSELSNSSIDWADNNLSYHQLFLKKKLLAESCFYHHWSLIQILWDWDFEISILSIQLINQVNQLSLQLQACWLFSSTSFYKSHWASSTIQAIVSSSYNCKHIDYLATSASTDSIEHLSIRSDCFSSFFHFL